MSAPASNTPASDTSTAAPVPSGPAEPAPSTTASLDAASAPPRSSARASARREPDHKSLNNALRAIYCYGVMFGAGESTFALFAGFIKAPMDLFGKLAGWPSLIGPLVQVLAANVVDKTKARRAAILLPVAVQSLLFIPLAWLAFATPDAGTYWTFLILAMLYYACTHFATPPWSSLISDLVPSSMRETWFARAMRSPTLFTLVCMLAVMGLLRWAGDSEYVAWIFAGAFALAGFARFIALLLIMRMHCPAYAPTDQDVFTFWQFIRRARESNFVKFVLFTGLYYFGANLAGPYFPPYFMYDLHFESYYWVAMTTGGTLAAFLTMLAWGRFTDRFGNKRALIYSSYLITVIPLAWMFSTNFWYLLAVHTIGNALWAGFNLASFNYILEACSAPKRARCFAYFNIIVGLGTFTGSEAGGWLYEHVPTTGQIFGYEYSIHSAFLVVLLLSCVWRLAVCLTFLSWFRELRSVPHFSLKEWFFQIAGSRISSYISFGVFFRGSDEEDDAGPPNTSK